MMKSAFLSELYKFINDDAEVHVVVLFNKVTGQCAFSSCNYKTIVDGTESFKVNGFKQLYQKCFQ